jgi:hypothetical protein
MSRLRALGLSCLTISATACLTVAAPPAPERVVPVVAVKARVMVQAPRWQAAPVEGVVAEIRRDSLWLLVDAPEPAPSSWVRPVSVAPPGASPAGPTVVGVPTACITEVSAWDEASRVAGASRGVFMGALIGSAVGLLASPEPTAWKVQTLPLAAPAALVGTALGGGLGWSRAGGRWTPVQLGPMDGPSAGTCVARAAPKKTPPKPTIAGKK